MVISRGDVFMVDFGDATGNEAAFLRPAIVLQGNVFNQVAAFGTVVVIPLTSNIFKAKFTGNILLKRGEANLPKASVALVSLITHVNKNELKEKLGTVSEKRISEMIDGLTAFIHYDQ